MIMGRNVPIIILKIDYSRKSYKKRERLEKSVVKKNTRGQNNY